MIFLPLKMFNNLAFKLEVATAIKEPITIVIKKFLKRVRDFADVNNEDIISLKRANDALNSLGVNKLGFDAMDIKYLKLLTSANKRPLGLASIAAALSEDENTIEDLIEPYLLANGYIERTARGRIASLKSFELLKLSYDKNLFE